jgi:Ni/Fe-hydrogenase subunit HybB-like protein
MSADARAQQNGVGYAARPVTKPPDWNRLVACDMLFSSLTSGLFLTAALGELLAAEVFAPLAKVAYPLALALLSADLVCLVLDLGDPFRFHHMLRVFKPTSPMSLGAWCMTAYSLPLTVAAALGLLTAGSHNLEWVRKAAVILGLLPALGAAVYKGVLLSTTAQPGWKDARWLGGYLANSALVLGCAVLLYLAVLLGEERARSVLRPALGLLLVLNVVPLGLVIANLRRELSRVYTPRQLGHLAALCIGGGTVLPLLLLLAGESLFLVLPAVLFVLLASLAIRFLIISLPHTSTLEYNGARHLHS